MGCVCSRRQVQKGLISMSEDQNENKKPGKLKRAVGKFDFLSVIAAILILAALLSSAFKVK